MSHRHQPAIGPSLRGAAAIVLAAVLAALVSAHAEPIRPDQIAYEMKVSEDPAAKVCILGLAIKGSTANETVDFQLVVARMKRGDALAGPAMFGFAIEVHDPQQRSPGSRALQITSAAFISDRYTAAARPRTTPSVDGSWVASTLDVEDGGELLDAAASGKFQIAYTRTRPIAARVFEVTSAPPLGPLVRFTGCIDGLQTIE
jgi:hypothetical protein